MKLGIMFLQVANDTDSGTVEIIDGPNHFYNRLEIEASDSIYFNTSLLVEDEIKLIIDSDCSHVGKLIMDLDGNVFNKAEFFPL